MGSSSQRDERRKLAVPVGSETWVTETYSQKLEYHRCSLAREIYASTVNGPHPTNEFGLPTW